MSASLVTSLSTSLSTFLPPSLPQLSTHLVSPLLSMVGELCRRQRELVMVLGRKDREIQDYKDHGATVSRSVCVCVCVCVCDLCMNKPLWYSKLHYIILVLPGHLETTPFDEKAFINEMTLSQVSAFHGQLSVLRCKIIGVKCRY